MIIMEGGRTRSSCSICHEDVSTIFRREEQMMILCHLDSSRSRRQRSQRSSPPFPSLALTQSRKSVSRGGGGGIGLRKRGIVFLLSFSLLTSLITCVGGKFGAVPVSISDIEDGGSSSSSASSLALLNLSGPQPSEKYISCHFNGGCFCKYDQKTEVYDSLLKLWQIVGFNETSFFRSVAALQREIREDPLTTYFFPESDIPKLAQLVVNSSSSSSAYHYAYTQASSTSTNYHHHHQRHFSRPLLEPGPVFEFVCLAVPMAVIPTEYSAHGTLSHVSVTGSELAMLDGSAFAGLEIQNIQLARDHLYSISEFAFSSMGDSLTVLDLSENNLDEIPLTAFKTLKALEWLNMNNNLLSSVVGDWFSVTDSIRQLSLLGNSIDFLPLNLFQGFGHLMWLDLTSNLLRNLSQDELSPNLQTLVLIKNRFQHFPTGVFHLQSLSYLLLGGNSIEVIPTELFPGTASYLNQMDLSENFIRSWPSRAFGAQLRVLDLELSKNFIESLPSGAFDSMHCFRLSLGYNRINMIDSEAFTTLESSLQYLNLENNRLSGIPWNALRNLTSLMHLYVGNNQLTDDVIGAPGEEAECKLTYLGLNGNQLTRIPRRLLSTCPNLRHINLGYNMVVHLDQLAILTASSRHLRKLSTLVLRNNPIFSLAFSGSGSVNGNGGGNMMAAIQQHQLPLHHPEDEDDVRYYNKDHDHYRNDDDHDARMMMMDILEESGGSGAGEATTGTSLSGPASAYSVYHVLPSIPNVFRTEAFPQLYELSLSFCQLSGELEPFPSLPLTNLEISMGLKSATTIRPAMFQALRNLEWLALDHNSLRSVSDYSFYSNRNLTYVNLEWNKLERLPRQMFHPEIHQSISQVRLSHNNIQIILSETFLSFPAIDLDLSYNIIQSIERHAFSVTFSNSPPSAMSQEKGGSSGGGSSSQSSSNPFYSSTSEENEEFSKTDDATASAQTLSSTSSVISPTLAFSPARPGLNLYLNRNKLTLMKPNALAGEKFSLVDLSYNNLLSFNFDTFGRKTILGGVNISHNNIERITVPKNRRIVVTFLDASFNPLNYRSLSGALVSLCPTDLLDLSHTKLERTDYKLFPINCSLREVNLNGNFITNLDPESFTNLRDLTVLRLSENQISFVPEILFIRNSKLNFLDLSKNKIRKLPRDALVGSAIESIKLGSNEFVTVPVAALSQISRRLRRLDMSDNLVEHLDSTMFESISGLVHLNISNNRLTILPDNAFSNLASLRELDLSNNNLRANFKELFHFLPKLKLLRLSNCGIKTLPLLPLPHLISLDLSSNAMVEIPLQSLRSLTRLRILILRNNELSSTRLPSFAPLLYLNTLVLSGNPLRSLTKDTFYGLPRLETLEILDLGRLDRFDPDALSPLVNLRSLAVETYPYIEKYRFRLGAVLSTIPHLEELFVHIKEPILTDQFVGGIFSKLNRLTITGHTLKRIEPSALEGLQNCFHMDLTITNTGVDDIPPRVFRLLQGAEWARLDIRNNKLSSLDSSALYPNRTVWFSHGTRLLQGGLILDGNEFNCDCDLVWIGEWLRRWLRESFESHTTAIPLVHAMYEEIRRPTCVDHKGGGKIIPLIELYSDVMCHASALSKASSTHRNHHHLLYPFSFPKKGLFTLDNLFWMFCLCLVATLSSSALPCFLFNAASSRTVTVTVVDPTPTQTSRRRRGTR